MEMIGGIVLVLAQLHGIAPQDVANAQRDLHRPERILLTCCESRGAAAAERRSADEVGLIPWMTTRS